MASAVNTVQVTTGSIKVPRVVLGKNSGGQDVYLYYDPQLERVVISGAMGLAYETGSRLYILDVTSPNNT